MTEDGTFTYSSPKRMAIRKPLKRGKPLKRTGSLKRSKLKKVSKLPLAKLQRALWVMVRALSLAKQKNEDGTIDCYTCGAKDLQGSNCQLGHMIPKSTCGAFLRYDTRILKFQCSRCNIWGGGMGAEFLRKMIIVEGQDHVDQIFRDKLQILSGKQAYAHYEMQLAKYRQELEDLDAKNNV